MKAEIGKSYLRNVPHKGELISFEHPAIKGTYDAVARAIDNNGLNRPTAAQTASLVYDAFQNKDGKYESEIIQILKDAWLWEFTGNLYLPKSKDEYNNGVIIEDNPTISGGKLVMNKNDLVKRLNNKDSNVRFVPFGFKTESQTVKELEKNTYIIGRYGEEGAEKIAEIASEYKGSPYLWSFDSVNGEMTRMSALYRGCCSDLLGVDGSGCGDNNGGRAFGVCSQEKK
jgi:hypothetical protein